MSRIRANQITNQSADGAPTVQNGLVISGITTSTTFSGSGASLTNIPSAQLTGALPALDGSNLTGLSGVSVANQADNRLITATGTTDALNGESGVTYDGTNFTVSSGVLKLTDEGSGSQLQIGAVGDFYIEHDGSNTYIKNTTGDTIIQNDANVKITASSGGTERFRFDSTGLSFDADTDSYIGRPSADKISITTGGSERFSVANTRIDAKEPLYLESAGSYIKSNQLRFNPSGAAYIDHGVTGQPLNFRMSSSSALDTNAMTINSSGQVTKPSQVGFHATGSATHTHSSNFVAEFDTEYFDIGGGYNNSNYRFTAPVAGRYFLYFQYLTYPNSDPSYKTFLFRKNGSSSGLYDQGFYRGKEGMQGDQTSQQMSSYIQLAENDYVEPYIELGGGTYKNYMGSGHAHFWGFLIH